MPFIIDHVVILTLPIFKNIIYSFLEKYGDQTRYNFVFSSGELESVVSSEVGESSLLISFGTGVIVRRETLAAFKAAYNFHPATPDYPGLDPHHFAVYDNARIYGATAHIMTEKVDNGEIIDVRRFDVEGKPDAMELLEAAFDPTFELMEDVFKTILEHKKLPTPINEKWEGTMCTKALKTYVCRVDPAIDAKEFQKLFHAFQDGMGRDHKNLYIDLHGHRFRYEGPLEKLD